MAGTLDDANSNIDQVLDRTLHAPHPQGFRVWVAGEATAAKDSNTIAEEDLRQGETIGIVAAMVILIVVFGAVAAAVVPVVLAITAAIGVALGLVSLLGLAFDLSFFVTNMVTMIGLAVGIDYSLFIVRATARSAPAAATSWPRSARLRQDRQPGGVLRDDRGAGARRVAAEPDHHLSQHRRRRDRGGAGGGGGFLTLLPALLAVMGDRVNALRVPVLFAAASKTPTVPTGSGPGWPAASWPGR